MLTEKDITDALVTWKGAGLTPPRVANLGEFQTMTRSMLSQYGRLDSAFWKKVVGILAHSERWPRFTDIDAAVKSLTEAKTPPTALPKPERVNKANMARIKAIVAHINQHGSFKGLLEGPDDKVKTYARHLFPDCSDEFISNNAAKLRTCKEADELCASGVVCGNCPFYGHRQFLKINKYNGYAYINADIDVCPKYPRKAV